jgi:hypothetical protein
MTRILSTTALAMALVVAALATPTSAAAQNRYYGARGFHHGYYSHPQVRRFHHYETGFLPDYRWHPNYGQPYGYGPYGRSQGIDIFIRW